MSTELENSREENEFLAEELFRRSFLHPEEALFDHPKFRELFNQACQLHGDFDSTLTEKQKEIFAKVCAASDAYASRTELATFTFAYRLGAWMMLNAIADDLL